jgi:hypothetical protein
VDSGLEGWKMEGEKKRGMENKVWRKLNRLFASYFLLLTAYELAA